MTEEQAEELKANTKDLIELINQTIVFLRQDLTKIRNDLFLQKTEIETVRHLLEKLSESKALRATYITAVLTALVGLGVATMQFMK